MLFLYTPGPLLSIFVVLLLFGGFFKSVFTWLFGPYRTSTYPERSYRDAISAWKTYDYRSPQCAAWAMDEAVDWAVSCTAPTKKAAYRELHSRLRAYSK